MEKTLDMTDRYYLQPIKQRADQMPFCYASDMEAACSNFESTLNGVVYYPLCGKMKMGCSAAAAWCCCCHVGYAGAGANYSERYGVTDTQGRCRSLRLPV